MRKKNLLDKIRILESKVDTEDVFITGVFGIMKFFQISYNDVMDMPIPAFSECIKFIKNVSVKKSVSGINIKGLGKSG